MKYFITTRFEGTVEIEANNEEDAMILAEGLDNDAYELTLMEVESISESDD